MPANIEFIEIGGKSRPVSFNQLSLQEYATHLDYTSEARLNTSVVYAEFYAGLYGGAYAKGLDIDFDFADVIEWVDELNANGGIETIQKVDKMWTETHIYRKWLDEFKEKVRALSGEPQKQSRKKKAS